MMTMTSTAEIPAITRAEAVHLAAVENRRMLELLRSLHDDEWTRPTDCPPWTVRDMAGHLLGAMEGFVSMKAFVHLMRAGTKAAGEGPFVDGMTAVQVAERADLTVDELLERMAEAGPRSAAARGKVPSLLRRIPMKEEVGGETETWQLGYLLSVILTRDMWMHRVDITRATGRELHLTADHDGRMIADIVAEWARRHGQPFTLHLDGPAGGTFASGSGGEEHSLDAVEFCRILSARAAGTGLLTQEVPF